MRRTGVLIAGWALATVLALLLGLQSVSAISNSVTNHRKASLSPASVKAALNRSTSSPSSSSSSESTESSDPASSSESTPPPAPASASSSSEDGGPASTGPGVVDEHSNPPTENGSQGEGASSDSSAQEHDSSSSTSPAPAPEDRTYQLVGGSVGVHFENGAARLLWATPNTGFSVESSGPGSQVDVRFLSDSHESRLRAFWENGPGQEIEEDDR